MTFTDLLLLAIALSMDAFAVAICTGLSMKRATLRGALTVGLYFGGFQAVMPLLGYAVATQFADQIIDYDHWIAFALLCFLGGKMILGVIREKKSSVAQTGEGESSLKPARMLPLAFATSVDALAVGVSFAFLRVAIIPAVSFIGVTTLLLSMLGVKIGELFGARFKSKAELAGGVILILIGLRILLEHLGVIGV